MVKRAIVYSRVSTDAQEREGTSLDTQERACLEHAKSWRVVERIRDTASGASLDRPGIERLRQSLRQGAVDVVVAYAVDRLSRNQNHVGILFDEVERAGAKMEFVTENFEDNAIARFILAAGGWMTAAESSANGGRRLGAFFVRMSTGGDGPRARRGVRAADALGLSVRQVQRLRRRFARTPAEPPAAWRAVLPKLAPHQRL